MTYNLHMPSWFLPFSSPTPVEKKRKQRMKKAGKVEEVSESYKSLVIYKTIAVMV